MKYVFVCTYNDRLNSLATRLKITFHPCFYKYIDGLEQQASCQSIKQRDNCQNIYTHHYTSNLLCQLLDQLFLTFSFVIFHQNPANRLWRKLNWRRQLNSEVVNKLCNDKRSFKSILTATVPVKADVMSNTVHILNKIT